MPDRTRGIRSVSGRTPSFWWGCGVFLLAILPFLPSAGYPFLVEWDDGRFVLFNDRLLPSLENALHLATHTFQTLYTPLPMLSLMVDRFFFGTLPAGYHWHNLLLHGVSALLLFLIFRRLEVRDWIAAAGALLWAVLPARVESVVWIAERKDLTAGVFAFAAFWLFLRAAAAEKASRVSAILLFLAGVSKPSTLPLFGVMVLYLYCRSGRWSSIRLALPQIVSALAATAIVTGISMVDLAGEAPPLEGGSGLLGAMVRFCRYVAASVLPAGMNPLHPRFHVVDNWLPGVFSAAGVALVLMLAARKSGLSWRAMLLFACAFGGMWLPSEASGRFTNADFCERYGYFPSAVVWGFLVVIAERLLLRHPDWRRGLAAGAVCWFVLCAGVTLWYLPVFSDTAKLFSYAVEAARVPNAKAMEGLALAGFNRNDPALIAQAGNAFLEAAEGVPEKARLLYENTGRCFAGEAAMRRGDLPLAAQLLLEPLNATAEPAMFAPEQYLGGWYGNAVSLLLAANRQPAALQLLNRQLDRGIGSEAELAFAAGVRCYLAGDRAGARQAWLRARELRPDDPRIEFNLRRLDESGAGDK